MSESIRRFVDKQPVPVVVIAIVLILCEFIAVLPGIIEQSECYRETAVKRIEVIFPGYRIGRWLMKPINSRINECAK